jgi:NAD(P)-dependent dehydrogenase (short-subunit alcohol dehydrogenase family)
VSDRSEVYAAVDLAEKELGGFDIIVNNAGIAQVQAIADVEPAESRRGGWHVRFEDLGTISRMAEMGGLC